MNNPLFTQPLYDVLNDAAGFFYDKLRDPRSEASKNALQYVTGRGLSQAYIDAYAVGYAPRDKNPNTLFKFLKRNYPESLINEAGLIYHAGGVPYDCFRDRIIFPVFDENCNIIAFGGRKMDNSSDEPKYMNSKETSVYKKSNELYGYHIARKNIPGEKFIIIVEGYTDLIALHQNKIYNSVACCGTAFSDSQLDKLTSQTSHFILVYDSDLAGLKAAIRLAEKLISRSLKFGFVELPDKMDPCSFIIENSRYDFMKKVYKRISFIDFILNSYKRRNLFNTPEQKTVCIEEILNLMALCPHSNYEGLTYFVNQLSDRTGFEAATIRKQLRNK